MAEVEAASAAPGEKRSAGRPRREPAPSPALLRASESGDPAVHQLLGAIYSAQQNGDPDAEAAAVAELGRLGFA